MTEIYPRRKTRLLDLGGVAIGGGQAVSIQSMNNTPTADKQATIAQLSALAVAGCDIGRLAVPDQEAALALADIVKAVNMPVVADIHFDYRLALAAIDSGVAGLRINPGNIGGADKVRAVARAAEAAKIPIRIGVNGGSLDKQLLAKYGGITAEALCESALTQAAFLEEIGFSAIKISLKATNLPVMIAAYRKMADISDYPLHVGVTEAGFGCSGSVKSALGIGVLLAEGIGDTIRVSLTGDPLAEVRLGLEILNMLGLRKQGWEFISCPTCGRTVIDVEQMARQVYDALSPIRPKRPLKVAVMGCGVNGPGEARDADIGIAGGIDGGWLFAKGEKIGYFPADKLVEELVKKAKKLAEE